MEKSNRACCVCEGKFSASFDGKPYCNKHWQGMYRNGTTEPKQRGRTTRIVVCGEYAKIVTSKDQDIFVDTADVNFLNRYSWCVSKTGYAVANIGGKVTKLHRYLLSPKEDEVIDHMNGNPLDNRRCNLRITCQKNNSRNVAAAIGSLTGIVGVSKTPTGRYRARITVDRKEIHIGTYETVEAATSARRKAEKKHFGQFAPSVSREVLA